MNPHIKTILTMLAAVVVFVLLVTFPALAKAAYYGLWAMLAVSLIGSIYGWIYSQFEYVETKDEPMGITYDF